MRHLILLAIAGSLVIVAPSGGATAAERFIRGDANANGRTDIVDAVLMLETLFGGGTVGCVDATDVNDDGTSNIVDPVALLNFLFGGGAPPPPPVGECGVDPTVDGLGCEEFPACEAAVVVLPVLDEDARVTETVDQTGGTINAAGADATRYELELPPDSLQAIEPQRVSVTPVVSIENLPLSGGFLTGVELAPDGLQLRQVATLTIELPESVPPEELIAFSYRGQGEDFQFVPFRLSTTPGSTSVVFRTTHFSGYGVGLHGTLEDCEAHFSHPTSYRSMIACRMGNARARGILDPFEDPEIRSAVEGDLRAYFNAILLPELSRAQSFVEIRDAVIHYTVWLGEAQYFFDPGVTLAGEVEAASSLLYDRIDGPLRELEEVCLESQDPCEKKEQLYAAFDWIWLAQQIEGILNTEQSWDPHGFCAGVFDEAVFHVDVQPPEMALLLDETSHLTALVRDAAGQLISADVEWTSSDPAVAEVFSDGRILALSGGETLVEATFGCDIAGSARIRVVDLNGLWEIETISSLESCEGGPTHELPVPAPYSILIVQTGRTVTVPLGDLGTAVGAIADTGNPVEPYTVSFSLVSGNTPDCVNFFTTGGDIISPDECEVICTPLSCSEGQDVTVNVAADGSSFLGQNAWEFHARWLVTLEEGDSFTADLSCSGVNAVAGTKE